MSAMEERVRGFVDELFYKYDADRSDTLELS